MAKFRKTDRIRLRPVENHDTAAWANIASQKDVSQVNIPSDLQVEAAKEYVDINQK